MARTGTRAYRPSSFNGRIIGDLDDRFTKTNPQRYSRLTVDDLDIDEDDTLLDNLMDLMDNDD